MNLEEAIKLLRKAGTSNARESQQRFGINIEHSFGVRVPDIRAIAKQAGKDHVLAQQLWQTNIHEARILASLVGEKDKVTKREMNAWVKQINSWDVCDGLMGNLYCHTPFAYEKANEWSSRKEEYVKRSAFSLIAYLAVHDKKAPDVMLEQFFPLIICEAVDDRNFVKKAVNWALRQIGKRNTILMKKAIIIAEEIQMIDSPTARWIANDALREFKAINEKKAKL